MAPVRNVAQRFRQAIQGQNRAREFFWRTGEAGVVREPEPHTQDKARAAYGLSWFDPFSWMESGGEPLRSYLEEETEYMERSLLTEDFRRLQELIRQEANEYAEGSTCGVEETIGNFRYYVRSTPEQPLDHYLRASLSSNVEETVLDVNKIAEATAGALEIGKIKLSDSQRRLAFTLQTADQLSTAIMKDLASGKELDSITGVHGIEWLADESTVLYTTSDDGIRPNKVWRHTVGERQDQDVLLLTEPSVACFLSLTKTKDNHFVVISSSSKTASEVHLVDAHQPSSSPLLMQERQNNLEYFVEHQEGRLLILTNIDGAGNNCLAWAEVDSREKRNWRVVVPERPGVAIEDIDVFRDFVVLWERHQGLPGFSVLSTLTRGGKSRDLKNAELRRPPKDARSQQFSSEREANHKEASGELQGGQPMLLRKADRIYPWPSARGESPCLQVRLQSFGLAFEGIITTCRPAANADYYASLFGLHVSSPVQPDTHLVVGPGNTDGTEQWIMYQPRLEARQSLDPTLKCRQEFATSPDGTKVAMTIVQKCQAGADGQVSRRPCLVMVYGAYGMNLDAEFDPANLSLLNRGWTLAYLHVRGGGELGRRWHEAGRQHGKLAALQDAYACIDHLISEGHSREGSLCLRAASAGAVLAGNLMISRPNAFRAALLRVPFLDVFTTMTSPEQALTVHEWDEWGNPEEPGGLHLLRALCPYQNLLQLPDAAFPRRFPATLLTIGLADERVPPFIPAKWAAAVRRKFADRCQLYVNVVEGGHFASGALEAQLDAREIAFLLHENA